MQYQPSQASANDILAYKGDAAFAGGYDANGIPAGIGADSMVGIQDMLKTINQQQFTRNIANQQQKIRDRDQSLQALSDPALQLGVDILDKDRPLIESERTRLMDMWKANPDLKNNPDAYLQFQKQLQKVSDMAVASKGRGIEYKRQMQAVAGDQNEQSRLSRIQHLDGQIGEGVYHQIDPYFNNPTFDADKYFKPVPTVSLTEPEYTIDKDGVAHVSKVDQTPLTAFTDPFTPEKLMENNGQGLQDLQILHDNFVNSKYATDENILTQMNTKLSQINSENKLSPNDPRFFKPVAVKNGDNWVVNESPGDFAKSLYAYEHYKRVANTTLAPDYQKQLSTSRKDQIDQSKANAEINKDNVQSILYRAQTKGEIAKTGYMKDYYEAMASKARAEGRATDAEQADEQAIASAPVTDAINSFTKASKLAFSTANPDHKLAIRNSPMVGTDILPLLKSAGMGNDWEYGVLPKEEGYMKLALQDLADGKGGADKPTEIVAIRPKGGDITQMKFVAIFKPTAKGQEPVVKTIDLPNAVDNVVRYNSGFKTGTATAKKIDAARKLYNDQLEGVKNSTTVASTAAVDSKQANVVPADRTKLSKAEDGSIQYEVSPGKYKKVKGVNEDKTSIILED